MDRKIDLNCDLGEWRDEGSPSIDEAIMPFVSSCNVACGGHIGDDESMFATVKLASKHNVAIGAHPGYPDRVNFGRVIMDIKPQELEDSLRAQILSLKTIVEKEDLELHHIKPHGALYNRAAKDRQTAEIVVSVIKSISSDIPVYLPPNSISREVAMAENLTIINEAFADRMYEDDLSLRLRSFDNAVLHKAEDVIAQLRNIVFNEKVLSSTSKYVPIKAETVCLHSDTKGAIWLARTINEFLRRNGVTIAAA